ncbi:hypothetical protein QQ965_00830 [Candidatus Saccharibacteria bacterium oral taxon 955]
MKGLDIKVEGMEGVADQTGRVLVEYPTFEEVLNACDKSLRVTIRSLWLRIDSGAISEVECYITELQKIANVKYDSEEGTYSFEGTSFYEEYYESYNMGSTLVHAVTYRVVVYIDKDRAYMFSIK